MASQKMKRLFTFAVLLCSLIIVYIGYSRLNTESPKLTHYNFRRFTNAQDSLKDWRLQESLKLGDLVQRRLEYLQNPTNCEAAKKLICIHDTQCGYACQIHHKLYCLVVAYVTNRTLVLSENTWPYLLSNSWWGHWWGKLWGQKMTPLLQPLSNCTGYDQAYVGPWTDVRINDPVQTMSIFSLQIEPRPAFIPPAVPDDLADRLVRFHSNPTAWWNGQLVRYLTRPRENLERFYDDKKQSLGFERPIVGVHIRRTDKSREAQYHEVEEYMNHVEEWFNIYEKNHPGGQRRVFLASDDPDVLKEAQKKYSHYTFISDVGVAQSADDPGRRFTETSLYGILQDIHFLSLCDFLVCTFSSNVCRLVYEVMQTMHGDASQLVKSLDDRYHFVGQNSRIVEAVKAQANSSNDNSLDMLPGDHIRITDYYTGRDGIVNGTNLRTGKEGLFLTNNTVDTVLREKMPTYPIVKEMP